MCAAVYASQLVHEVSHEASWSSQIVDDVSSANKAFTIRRRTRLSRFAFWCICGPQWRLAHAMDKCLSICSCAPIQHNNQLPHANIDVLKFGRRVLAREQLR